MGNRTVSSPGAARANSGSMLGNNTSFEAADVERERARHEANEEGGDKNQLVIPQMTAEMKEEEARRRSTLSQELSDRGICPEYDPMDGAGPEQRCAFDVGSIMPNEMRAFLHNPTPKTA